MIFLFRGPKSPAYTMLGFAVLGLAGTYTPQTAVAQTVPGQNYSCDFSRVTGMCQAVPSPNASGGYHLFTDALRCTSVDYTANGRMRRLFMKTGRGLDRNAGKDLQVSSCKTYASIDAPQPVTTAPAPTAGRSIRHHTNASYRGFQRRHSHHPVQTPPSESSHGHRHSHGYGHSRGHSRGHRHGHSHGYRHNHEYGHQSGHGHQNRQAIMTKSGLVTPAVYETRALVSAPVAGSISGKWCDSAGKQRLLVLNDGMEMTRLSGQKVVVGFNAKSADSVTYRAKQLFSTFSGQVRLSGDGSLVWTDIVTPGVNSTNRLLPCKPRNTTVARNFNTR